MNCRRTGRILLNSLSEESYLPPFPDLSIFLSWQEYLLLIFLTHDAHSSFYSLFTLLLLKKICMSFLLIHTNIPSRSSFKPTPGWNVYFMSYLCHLLGTKSQVPLETYISVILLVEPLHCLLEFQVFTPDLFVTWDLDLLNWTPCCLPCCLMWCPTETTEHMHSGYLLVA